MNGLTPIPESAVERALRAELAQLRDQRERLRTIGVLAAGLDPTRESVATVEWALRRIEQLAKDAPPPVEIRARMRPEGDGR